MSSSWSNISTISWLTNSSSCATSSWTAEQLNNIFRTIADQLTNSWPTADPMARCWLSSARHTAVIQKVVFTTLRHSSVSFWLPTLLCGLLCAKNVRVILWRILQDSCKEFKFNIIRRFFSTKRQSQENGSDLRYIRYSLLKQICHRFI